MLLPPSSNPLNRIESSISAAALTGKPWHPAPSTAISDSVWCVAGDKLRSVPVENAVKLFSGDCYVLQYTYPGIPRDETIFYAWHGHASIEEDRVCALSQMVAIASSIKGAPVLAQITQDKEPDQFLWIVRTLIVFKVSSSLHSSYCYILQTRATIFTWIGSLTSTRDHELLDKCQGSVRSSHQSSAPTTQAEEEEIQGAKSLLRIMIQQILVKRTESSSNFSCMCFLIYDNVVVLVTGVPLFTS
ncbi:hypothetical protein Droror1_Dr00014620 [Drosera rotundifolia]